MGTRIEYCERVVRRFAWSLSAGLTALLLLAGCAHGRRLEREQRFLTIYTPHPPPFINGPAALLLTNSNGFEATIKAETQGFVAREDRTSGELLGRGSKLLYAPQPKETADKNQRAGGFSFIWDTAENRGFVLSEALQGYAPISANWKATQVLFQPGQRAPEKLLGHETETARAIIELSDGARATFEIRRAIDLSGFPLQVRAGTNATPLSFEVTKLRFEPIPADTFTVPDGYTQYASPEALSDELAARQRLFRARPRDTGSWLPSQAIQPTPP